MQVLAASALVAGIGAVTTAHNYDRARGFPGHDGRSCSERTLRGSYLFAATGFNIVSGVAVPKAINEVIEFNGDGTLTVPAVSLSVNGVISHPPSGIGDYAVEDTCRGTLVFVGGPSFDIVVARNGQTVWMFQTNPNTVFEGTATRFDR
jgi:hypothetical protein